MNKLGWQSLAGGIIYFVAICIAAWGNGSTEPLPIDLYLIAFGIAFVGYALVCRAVLLIDEHSSIPLSVARFVLLLAIIARLVMFAAPHRHNSDVSRYVWDGYLVNQGINPYEFVPGDSALSEFQSNERFSRLNPDFNEVGTVYGPVAMAAFALANTLPGEPEQNIRLIMLFGDFLAILILAMTLRQMGQSDLWLVLYALNPLLIDSFSQRGQMEGIMMPLLAGVFFCFARREYLLSGILIAAATAAKLHILLLLPIAISLLIRSNRKQAMRLALGFSLAICVFATPYLLAGQGSLAGLLTFGSNWQANSSFFSLFKLMLSDSAARSISLALFTIIFAQVIIAGYCAEPSAVQLATSTCFCLLGLLLLAPAVFPWYLTWCLPLAPILAGNEKHRWLVLPILVWSMVVMSWYLSFLVYEPGVVSYFGWIQWLAKTASAYVSEPWKLLEYAAVLSSIAWAVLMARRARQKT